MRDDHQKPDRKEYEKPIMQPSQITESPPIQFSLLEETVKQEGI